MKRPLFFLILVFALPLFGGLMAQDAQEAKVEVYYFHGTKRCPGCLAIEEQTRVALEEFFKAETASGSVVFRSLNLEEKENEVLVEKFEIGWSSLILYNPQTGEIINMTDQGFADARTNPEKFRKELKEKIESLKS